MIWCCPCCQRSFDVGECPEHRSTDRSAILRALHVARAICFGSGVDTHSGAVKGEEDRLDVAEALNAIQELLTPYNALAKEMAQQRRDALGPDHKRSESRGHSAE